MKVTEKLLSDILTECGLTPIKESWEIKVENYYELRYGKSTSTDYELDTQEGISLRGFRITGNLKIDMNVYYSKRNQFEVAEKVSKKLEEKNFDSSILVDSDYNLRNLIIQKITKSTLFKDELERINNLIQEILGDL